MANQVANDNGEMTWKLAFHKYLCSKWVRGFGCLS